MTATTEKTLDTEDTTAAEVDESEETEADEVEAEEVEAKEAEAEEAVDSDDSDDSDDSEDDDKPLLRGRDKARGKRPKGRIRSSLTYLRSNVLLLLLIASLVVSGFLGWKQWQQHELNQAGEQARQAAIAYAGVLTSIDSNNVDQNFRQVLDGATGEFKDMYTQSSVQLRQLLIDNKASAHGVVVDSAVQTQSKNKVVVLLFIDQTVANMAVPDPRIDRSRIKVTMEKVDGRWRAAKVQLL